MLATVSNMHRNEKNKNEAEQLVAICRARMLATVSNMHKNEKNKNEVKQLLAHMAR